MTDDAKQLIRMALVPLGASEVVTGVTIREVVSSLRHSLFTAMSDEEAEDAARALEERLSITMEVGEAVSSGGHAPWVERRRIEVDWFYWDRYADHLIDEEWPPSVVTTIGRDTEAILDLLQDPAADGVWDRRGMVIGNVQSGKTANYLGLLAKAADAGYRAIVIIAGIHETLRSQTQERVDAGFLGWDSGKGLQQRGKVLIGVGLRDQRRTPASFTTRLRDFNRSAADQAQVPLENMTEPAVFVVKKHPKILESLIGWLRAQPSRDAPLLLIDDEADNASINIKYGKDAVSTINGQIRQVLSLFPKSAYVGYTATPFANIFIDPDSNDEMFKEELFPRDFIYALDAPTNYFGAPQVFGDVESVEPRFVRFIDDNEDRIPLKHKKTLQVDALPDSLRTAVAAFLVASSIRILRGDGSEHRSMLVNVSVNTDVQERVAVRLDQVLQEFKDALKVHHGRGPDDALASPVIRELHEVWQDEFSSLDISWHEAFTHLRTATAPTTVVRINSRSPDRLDYERYPDGRFVIAVGGFSLSRGLTLSGLIVSYFLRNSRMYDTLMQMARWFGYRPGYQDLCRVWMPSDAAGWYAHIADSSAELIADVKEMRARGGTPMDFGLRVRSHPDRLMATSKVKMGAGESRLQSFDFSTRRIETPHLPADEKRLEANRVLCRRFLSDVRASVPAPNFEELTVAPAGHLIRDVPVGMIEDFLGQFERFQFAPALDGDPLVNYVRERRDSELQFWDLYLPGLSSSSKEPEVIEGFRLVLQERKQHPDPAMPQVLKISSRHRVASRGSERVGVHPAKVAAEEEKFARQYPGVSFPDEIYRTVREKPLLVLHYIRLKNPPPGTHDVVTAWSISFPNTSVPSAKTEYLVNPTYIREHFGAEMGDEYE